MARHRELVEGRRDLRGRLLAAFLYAARPGAETPGPRPTQALMAGLLLAALLLGGALGLRLMAS
jgi:hypothetical protein